MPKRLDFEFNSCESHKWLKVKNCTKKHTICMRKLNEVGCFWKNWIVLEEKWMKRIWNWCLIWVIVVNKKDVNGKSSITNLIHIQVYIKRFLKIVCFVKNLLNKEVGYCLKVGYY